MSWDALHARDAELAQRTPAWVLELLERIRAKQLAEDERTRCPHCRGTGHKEVVA